MMFLLHFDYIMHTYTNCWNDCVIYALQAWLSNMV